MNRIAHNQMSLFDLYSEVDELTSFKHTTLFDIFDNYINIFDMIPQSFYNAYYSHVGSNREFPLEGMIKALVFYDLLALPTINTLVFVIDISSDFRKFLNFPRTPHKSLFTRFKSTFDSEVYELFHHSVDLSNLIKNASDDSLGNVHHFNTTGFELYIKDNNPEFYELILKHIR